MHDTTSWLILGLTNKANPVALRRRSVEILGMSRQFVWFAAHTAIEPGHVECMVCLLLLTDGCASRVWTRVVTDVVRPSDDHLEDAWVGLWVKTVTGTRCGWTTRLSESS